MNRMERLTGILLLLQEQSLTSEQIARRFEISKRTVLRDIQALSEIGVPIVAIAGPGGGYSLPSDYRLAPLPLTTREVFLLLLSLSVINKLPSTAFMAERTSLAAKLRAILPRQDEADVERLLTMVAVEMPERDHDPDHGTPFLEALLLALEQGLWVRVSYQSADQRSTQHPFPRQITTQNGYWYCRAYSFEHEQERTYRIDRMLELTRANDEFQAMPEPVDEQLPYEHESHPEVITRLTARGVAWFESEPHLGHRVQRNPDGSGVVTFRCPPHELDWFARFFASLGAEAEVCAPPELQERLLHLGRGLVARYQK